MDERKLEELFRDSVRAVPPASFDEEDIATASRRITARRRVTATVGGTAVAAAVLVGGIGAGTGWFTSSTTTTAASPPPVAPLTAEPAPQLDTGGVSPRSVGCRPDPTVVEAVTAALPEAAGTAPTSVRSCPTGAKAAAFALREGAAAGQMTVLVSPAGAAQAGQSTPGDVQRPDGAQQSVRKARSGKLVVVLSEPEAGSPAAPFGARVAGLADDLVPRF